LVHRALLLSYVSFTDASSIMQELFTTNAMCTKKNCVNPIFPGLEDLHTLSAAQWRCATLQQTAPSMGFCRGAINYDPAIPAPMNAAGESVENLVQRQDNAASTAFVYHLSGLGMEPWEYTQPDLTGDDCIKSIWRTVCYTYFPRSMIGCQPGMASVYQRPCQSSCMNYVRACQVECCDESVQCVFTHKKQVAPGQLVTTSGYMPYDGPSSLCTGSAWRSARGSLLWPLLFLQAFLLSDGIFTGVRHTVGQIGARRIVWMGSLLVVLVSMQGCNYEVPVHHVGNWRGEPDYLISYEFVPPGGTVRDARLNSCSLSRLSQTLQCSGRGVCKSWDMQQLSNTQAFCTCDRDWADPECRTKRKSQLAAYLLSIFFGPFGVDQFYLGFPRTGIMKLLTLGGFGVWWVVDIFRIGSAPIHAHNFRVANDLPHWGFVVSAVFLCILVGFTIAYFTALSAHGRRRKEAMLAQSEEEWRNRFDMPVYSVAYESDTMKKHPYAEYGAVPYRPEQPFRAYGPPVGANFGTPGPYCGAMPPQGIVPPQASNVRL